MNTPDEINASIVHKIRELYKIIYFNSRKIAKGDKLGIRTKTEQACLNCIRLAIEAALAKRCQKMPLVEKLRLEVEITKQLIRLEKEIDVVSEKTYILWQQKLHEISIMANGWINYLQAKGSK